MTQMIPTNDDGEDFYDAFDEESKQPFWRCEECGHESHTRPMPKNREAYYQKMHKGIGTKCPKCKSETFVPIGF